MTMEGYRKLQVYEKSYRQVVEIYRITKNFPREELYAMTSQLRRAAASIPLNIAEGYAKRESQSEFRRFLNMAIGSAAEVSVLLELSRDLDFMNESDYQENQKIYAEVGKMLNALSKRVKEQI